MEIYLQELLRAPSAIEWLRFAEILAGISITIGIGEAVRLALHWSPEFTRKLVHISVALLIFFAPNLFVSALPPLILAVSFTLFAYAAIKLGLLKSLHSVKRGAYGTVYYPFAFFILVLLFWNTHPEIVSLSMLALGIGDASAAIVGESIKNPILFHLTSDKKSVQGSTAMLMTTAVGLLAGLTYFDGVRYSGQTIAIAVSCAALTATAWEALSSRALDNLTIPLSVSFVLYYVLIPTSAQDVSQFAIGTILGITVAAVAYYARFLKASGAVATFLLASFVFGVGGWKWTTPILTFFVLSSLLSKLGSSAKREAESECEKSGTRDAGQVAANGGVAGVLLMLQYLFQNIELYPMYLGAIAAVTADTWGTEIGTLLRGRTVSIVSLKTVPPGTNGGVSVAGLIAGLLGASTIALSALRWQVSTATILMVIVAGVIASIVDSVVGSTLQAKYCCARCGKISERTHHCGETSQLVGGIRWINNDVVNVICAMAGAVAIVLFIAAAPNVLAR